MATTNSATVECPKCFGSGELRHFRNVHGGTCFLCGGAKAVTAKAAGQWLAAQMRQDTPRNVTPVTTENTPKVPTKWVKIDGLGEVRICKYDNDFTLLVNGDAIGVYGWNDDSVGYLHTNFRIVGGRVVIGDEICNGLDKPEIRELLRASLQKAMR